MPVTHKQEKQLKEYHNPGCTTKHDDDFTKSRCSYKQNGYDECNSKQFNRVTYDKKTKQEVSAIADKRSIYNVDFTADEKAARRLPTSLKVRSAKTGFEDTVPANSASEDDLFSRSWKFGHKKEAMDGSVRNPLKHPKAWWIGPAMPDNFKSGYLPYNHMYHHIMPWEAFKHEFNLRELKCLQSTEYNINGGSNMIILPVEDEFAFALALMKHPNNHPDYNREARQCIAMIKVKISEQAGNHGITSKTNANYKDELENWQRDMFDSIVQMGAELAEQGMTFHVNYGPRGRVAGVDRRAFDDANKSRHQ